MKAPKHPGRISFLFLGGAKRVAMAQMFKDACRKRGFEGVIVGYELSRWSSLAQEGTIVEGLRWSDPAVYADLDRVCRKYEIDIVVPFVDAAVGVAAEFVRSHSTTQVFSPVGERADVEKMFDKCAAAALFESAGLPIPATYRAGMSCSSLIAKPRFGSASKGIVAIDSEADFKNLAGTVDDYLIQERIDKRKELTVDCYVSLRDGEVYAISPRVREEVSGGEAVRTTTVEDGRIYGIVRKTLSAARLYGAVTVQLIQGLESDNLMVMEVNPRLGGGAVASVHAGVDLPGLIIDDAFGNELKQHNPQVGVTTVRYLADVVFYPNEV